MNRRGFLKSIGLAIAAISGLGAVKTKEADYVGEIQVKRTEPLEFEPDKGWQEITFQTGDTWATSECRVYRFNGKEWEEIPIKGKR